MQGLFSVASRQDIYNNILAQLQGDDRIIGIISFGAQDKTFSDDFDGIDLLAVLANPTVIDIVFSLWVKRLQDFFAMLSVYEPIISYPNYHIAFLLNDYLSIELHLQALNKLVLIGTEWCVAYDEEKQLSGYLEHYSSTPEERLGALYQKQMRIIWKPIVSCVTALQRDNLWLAISELSDLREKLVEIAGLRQGQYTQEFQNLHHLPDMFLVQLRHTMPTNVNAVAIRRALRVTINLLFQESSLLDAQYGMPYTHKLEHKLSGLVDLLA